MHSCGELMAALNDASVSRVQLMPTPGGYNCSAEEIAPHSIVVAGREVMLEGAGPEPTYVDVRGCAILYGLGMAAALPSLAWGQH